MNIADRLIENTIRTKNPSVIGLDPDLKKIPQCYKNPADYSGDSLQQAAEAIRRFNADIIDAIHDLIPAVKPQIAFYEKYGSHGIRAFEETVAYAKSKGLIVVTDAKRNDIGNTAMAYAQAHLGKVESLTGEPVPAFGADFLTVSPFLGRDSIAPFVEVCAAEGKGIFVLVKTSNPGAVDIQDVRIESGATVSQSLAEYVAQQAAPLVGAHGYSPIGAVVGATWPEDAGNLRRIMPASYFLVPGYGTQGGSARDVVPCFGPDGLGAIVNSSRGILYSHMSDAERASCTREAYLASVRNAAMAMQRELYAALTANCPRMAY